MNWDLPASSVLDAATRRFFTAFLINSQKPYPIAANSPQLREEVRWPVHLIGVVAKVLP